MTSLLPRREVLASPPWWLRLVGTTAAALVATLLSYAVHLTDIAISPLLLVPGVGMGLLWRWGLSLWPGIVLGDMLGQWFVHDRTLTLVVVSAVIHLVAAVAAAAWARRVDARPRNLVTTAHFTGIVLAVSAGATVLLETALAVVGHAQANGSVALAIAWEVTGFAAGFLVAGALTMAWLAPRAEVLADLRRPIAAATLATAGAAALVGFRTGIGIAGLAALLLSLGLAARCGTRWGTAAMFVVSEIAVWAMHDGMAPFGGATADGQALNAMFAIALFALAGLIVAGYHAAGPGPRHRAPVVAATFAVLMVVAGVSSLAANRVALEVDEPFVLSGLVALGAALVLTVLRFAHTPERPASPRGLGLAALAGAIYVFNLVVYLAAVPLIGSGTATALSMTAPLAVVLLSLAIYRTRPSAGMVIAVVMIVVGAFVAASGSLDDPLGIVLALGSAVIFAVSLPVTSLALRHAGVVDVALAAAVGAAVVALTIGVIVEGPGAFVLTPPEVGELALAALGAQLVPMLGRSWALDQISPNLVGAEGVLAPVVTGVLSILFIDTVVARGELAGLIIIAVGALVATLAGSRSRGAQVPGSGG